MLNFQASKRDKEFTNGKREFKWGNSKMLIPGLRTPTTGQVHGLPTDLSRDYPYRPLYGPPLALKVVVVAYERLSFTG